MKFFNYVELRIMTVGIVTDKCGSQLVFNTNPKIVLNFKKKSVPQSPTKYNLFCSVKSSRVGRIKIKLIHKYIYKKTNVLQNQLTDKHKQYLRNNLTFVDTKGVEFMNSHITLTLLIQIDDHKHNFD